MSTEEIARADFVLSPLLTDQKLRTAEYRRRSKLHEFKSVHAADADEFVAKGWEVHKLRKRSTVLSRLKTHDRQLEDRCWCLLSKMAYEKLNGESFKISFTRASGTKGQKQIDVFGCDQQTAFVVECKSRSERGRRSLQKDLSETRALQRYIRNAVVSLLGKGASPKIVWLYATSNIIWSETDLERAHDFGISVVTENELQYFEAFIKHMGPAGKYQVLAEFLKGQKIPHLSNIRLPAIKGKIAGETFYSFVASPRRLLPISFVNHLALKPPGSV